MLYILTPVYNDWESLSILLENIDGVLSNNGLTASIIVVNDGSSATIGESIKAEYNYKSIKSMEILNLVRNFGHQKALAIGLNEVAQREDCDYVIVMDADGEDSPQDIIALIEKAKTSRKIVCAQRKKRSEGFLFVFFYKIFKALFKLATSKKIDFGNFSIIPHDKLRKLLFFNEIWSHLPATLIKSKIQYETIPTIRGERYKGKSKMNFLSLVNHGLSGILVFGDIVGLRAVITAVFLIFLCIMFLIILMGIKFFTTLAIPGWTSYLTVLVISVMLQILTITTVFTFIFMNSTAYTSIQPIKDFRNFIDSVEKLR